MKNFINGLAPTLLFAAFVAVTLGGTFANADSVDAIPAPAIWAPTTTTVPTNICYVNKGGPGPCVMTSDYWEALGYDGENLITSLDELETGGLYCVVNGRYGFVFDFTYYGVARYGDLFETPTLADATVIYTRPTGVWYVFASDVGLEAEYNGDVRQDVAVFDGSCLKP